MRKLPIAFAAGLGLASPVVAQEAPSPAPSPNELVAAAPADEWVAIVPSDLLVMTLAPDRDGKPRQVVIQLMPPPFSQGWIGNIRKLAAAKWWDGTSINRVQDNYVVQWGDPHYDNPEAAGEPKLLPEGLRVMGEAEYVANAEMGLINDPIVHGYEIQPGVLAREGRPAKERLAISPEMLDQSYTSPPPTARDNYADATGFYKGWPLAGERKPRDDNDRIQHFFPAFLKTMWPVHCYGMVGVGRNYSPDTGSGAELYTVIGHAPRHLDRNIALVGRVIEGMEHLSSLPRGTGPLGFYEKAEQRVTIRAIRLASELPTAEQPRFEYLSTESASFARYADARASRRDAFFITPAGGADVCNIPVPVRRTPAPGAAK